MFGSLTLPLKKIIICPLCDGKGEYPIKNFTMTCANCDGQRVKFSFRPWESDVLSRLRSKTTGISEIKIKEKPKDFASSPFDFVMNIDRWIMDGILPSKIDRHLYPGVLTMLYAQKVEKLFISAQENAKKVIDKEMSVNKLDAILIDIIRNILDFPFNPPMSSLRTRIVNWVLSALVKQVGKDKTFELWASRISVAIEEANPKDLKKKESCVSSSLPPLRSGMHNDFVLALKTQGLSENITT